MGKTRILILGGTTEARNLGESLALRDDLDVLLSLAGRTAKPLAQPVPTRTGGFGGSDGLAAYLKAEAIDLLIDATHPFAQQMSLNAETAIGTAGIPAFRLQRAAWPRIPGDRWISVSNLPGAVAVVGSIPRRVFLAIGRQEAHHFNAAPKHRYLVRSVDPVEPALTVPDVRYLLATGPFNYEDELALLAEHRIDVIVAKNSGGAATYAKIEAARTFGIEIIMVERAALGGLPMVETVEAALQHIDYLLSGDRNRGV